MTRIITINSNDIARSLSTRDILTKKLIDVGFEVYYEFDPRSELIISIGGDGSFLKTVHDFDFPDIPIIGINTGHLGFFTDITPDDIDSFIDDYMRGNYFVQDMAPLEITICTKDSCIEAMAINEVVVKGHRSRVIHLNLQVNNHFIEKFSGDGMLISTPTGSTAYNYSAGGSIVDPSLKLIQLTPLSPINTTAYRSFTSSIILPYNSTVKIAPEYRFENSILMVIDGIEYKFNEIIEIVIISSSVRIKLLRLSNYEFWSRVSEKFL